MLKTLHRLFFLLAASLSLSACQQFQEDLGLLDLPNFQTVLFDLNCGEFGFYTFKSIELCGGGKDSFGFLYEEDKVVKVILDPTEGDHTLLYTPTYSIAFHSDYLKEGQILNKSQALASCSRFRKEYGNDPIYYTEYASEFELKIIKHKGEQTHHILGDSTQWELEWKLNCPQLQMKAQGKDQIDISRDPIPKRWKEASTAGLPPAPN
ncbi:hypothetical protein COW36_11340 [bacterium (Candidatus Blackallbacteria) CG17_big_fil_post_rev_8_21_14_2_50_48_46]|uniref:Lipoprotein n=1 Tax=bacterium (Candidatus Blackallbacteria) CG17_big_fil_post_rev_8_21_14_2_50_48_46 TaxID=2014261 RepID=A0A2M7G4P7_9BACT|nr:MAG: hypothetical protein COW64_18435 [bacterium (Candidatus Blackallbacteria) CG18_big_fil_WC_8_21_14_2_50_49_26]PIW16869.1 MAG: hypothetical protein COW36_11340 [bacterium (Candidatus Blackallbacteria) CG17_big_fil_post_rev_8_21_14_2_50_48_46]PIW48066.1 MAG: hypothetical protein COW20_11055 [bacterium (Candidatus Blackallbacteria) CG13_big_fil_rev_8_21_14_2_50_49_14]